MTREPDNLTNEPGEALDSLLAQARWPAPAPGADDRLAEMWKARSPLHRVRQWRPIAIAIAAAVLLALGIPRLWQAIAPPASPRLAQDGKPALYPAPAPPVSVDPRVPSRPATAYERMVLLSDAPDAGSEVLPRPGFLARRPGSWEYLRHRRPGPQSAPELSAPTQDTDQLMRRVAAATGTEQRRKFINEMLNNAGPDGVEAFLRVMLVPDYRDDALSALRASPSPPTALLLQRFDDAHVEYRLAAARALGVLCGEDVRGQLQQMVLTDAHRREALAALVWCPHSGPFLDAARQDRSVDAQFRAVSAEVQSIF